MIDAFSLRCKACDEIQPVDGHWRALWVDAKGALRVSPAMAVDERCFYGDTVYACGQGSALVLVERWLHTGTFEPAQAHIPQPQPTPEGDSAQ